MPHKTLIVIVVLLIVAGFAFLEGKTYLIQTTPSTGTPVATTTSSGTNGIVAYSSGIEGTVSLGPTCPVERNPPDPGCADKPYPTIVSVRHAGSDPVFATVDSDTSGAFKISLPPGEYTITAGKGSMLPRCASVNVSVGPTDYVTAPISCDTGIR
jgi:hypothetical protein